MGANSNSCRRCKKSLAALKSDSQLRVQVDAAKSRRLPIVCVGRFCQLASLTSKSDMQAEQIQVVRQLAR